MAQPFANTFLMRPSLQTANGERISWTTRPRPVSSIRWRPLTEETAPVEPDPDCLDVGVVLSQPVQSFSDWITVGTYTPGAKTSVDPLGHVFARPPTIEFGARTPDVKFRETTQASERCRPIPGSLLETEVCFISTRRAPFSMESGFLRSAGIRRKVRVI